MSKLLLRDEVHKGYIDFDKNEARNMRLQNLGADISSPVDGLIILRTDTNKVRARINGAWQDMATMNDVTAAGISANLVDAKGDLIVGTADNTVARKAAGANGTFLQAQSGQADGLLWTALADADIPTTIMRDSEGVLQTLADAKGDIVAATAADVWGKLPVGANDTLLVAASGQSTGLQWRTLVASDIDELLATNDLTDWPRSAALDLNGQKLTGVADGTNPQDAATFGQVNALLQGQVWKNPVRAATTANITLSGTQTVDGVALAVGDRVLVKNQTTASQNGIYVVAAGAWTRATDANIAAEINRATVVIQEGTAGSGDIYTETAVVATVDTDTVTFTKTGEGNTLYTADEVTLTLSGQQFAIKTGGISNAQVNAAAAIARSKLDFGTGLVNADIAAAAAIAYSKLNLAASIVNADVASGAAIAYSKLALGSSIVNADVAAGAAIAYSKLALAAAITAADVATGYVSGVRVARVFTGATVGGATSEVITHNLGTRDVSVTVCDNATPWAEVEIESERTSTTTITLKSPINIPASYRVTIIG